MNDITFTYLGEPVAFARPRTMNGKRWFNDERYDRFKRYLAKAINDRFGSLLITDNLKLTATFYRSTKRRIDLDNLVKAINDAMQDAQLIKDDNQIHEAILKKDYDKQNPRIEFTLERLD